ncbi:MAG: cellulase [Bacteroidales bacterium]|nr:cellulase [Bacteroidales bacterium]
MNRRKFLNTSAGASVGTLAGLSGCSNPSSTESTGSKRADNTPYPLAITMWEFSWLERKWPGAGYEDWDKALSELVERGYDAIRIDAFPHLIYNDPDKEYLLYPQWTFEEWGSPSINRVKVQPNLNLFLEKCREYNIRVGLSSWFREDENDLRMRLNSPEKHAAAWLKTLHSIDEAGLMDVIIYVDLCNEWTGPDWCPYFVNDPPEATWTGWNTKKSLKWMHKSTDILREHFPDLPYTFSFTGEVNASTPDKGYFEMLDFLEPHIWMTSYNGSEFYRETGYVFNNFSSKGYESLALNGKRVYDSKKDYWNNGLKEQIYYAAKWSEVSKQPLITTECWGVVNFRDWPMLDWGYIKELCAVGTEEAAKTGRWLAIGTSNFCGPQFVGMWRDIKWHQQLTRMIHESTLADDLRGSLLAKRMSDFIGKIS